MQRHQLHVALAKFDESPEQAAYVLEALDGIEDRHLASVIRYLGERPSLNNEQLIARIRQSMQESNPNFLALCSLLASRDKENSIWSEIADPVCAATIAKRSSQLAFWSELLQPAKKSLLPVLIRMLEDSPPTESANMNNLLQLAESFASNNPAAIARLAGRCPPATLTSLLSAEASPIELAVELREQLKAAAAQHKFGTAIVPADTALLDYLRKLNGHLFNKSAGPHKYRGAISTTSFDICKRQGSAQLRFDHFA